MGFVWVLAAATAILAAGSIWQKEKVRHEQQSLQAPGLMLDVPGARMHVLARGEGQPVVLLSGWGVACPTVDFQPLAKELLSRGFRVIVPEKPGYGFSSLTKAPRALDTVVDELHEALQKAGEKGPYILLGHSMAGTEILRWACRYPTEVKALYALDAPAPLCYLTVPAPPAWMGVLQRMQRATGLRRLCMSIPKLRKRYWKYLNNYRFLDPSLLPVEKAMTLKNQGNRVIWDEITRLKENAKVAGDTVPDGIPLTMFIASDTQDKRWQMLQPAEDEYIAKNHARTVRLEGLHNLQHYQPRQIAQEIAKDGTV